MSPKITTKLAILAQLTAFYVTIFFNLNAKFSRTNLTMQQGSVEVTQSSLPIPGNLFQKLKPITLYSGGVRSHDP
jgi:hypothetical protein